MLAGLLEESGYIGRIRAVPGDVLIHPPLDCHANQKVIAGLKIVRLNWSEDSNIEGLYRLKDPDAIARIAEKDVRQGSIALEHLIRHGGALCSPGKKNDWPDLLAEALAENTCIELAAWAEAHGLTPETVSRGFSGAYGIAPAGFRAEVRAREAWLRITRESSSLSRIAAETGFADQAHMTRWVHRISGAPPRSWRTTCLSSPSVL